MSDFIRTKSSLCLALYHLEGFSYMLCITNKSIYNRFKRLVFMVSASPVLLMGPHWNKQQIFWERQGESGANSISTSTGVVLSWCLAPDGFPIPTEVPALSGSLCLAAVAPGEVWLYCHQLCCFADKDGNFWCDAFGESIFPVLRGFFLLRKMLHQCRT